MDLLTWFHVCIVLCQTKPRLSLTEISKIVEISALKYGCLGSVVSLAMFLTGPFSVPKWEKPTCQPEAILDEGFYGIAALICSLEFSDFGAFVGFMPTVSE